MIKRKLPRLFGYAAVGFAVLSGAYILVIRPWHQRWGATTVETAAPMEGDELVPVPNWRVTRFQSGWQ